MSDRKLHFETIQIHGGYKVDESLARGIAIHPTAAYHFSSCDYAANLFTLSEPGYIYTRLHNPTTAAYGSASQHSMVAWAHWLQRRVCQQFCLP